MKVYYVPLHVLVRQDTLPNFFGLLPLLRTILVRENIQLVHAHQALSSMAHEGIFHAKNMGLKAVFSDHSLFGFADLGSILTNKLLRFALADVDHVVCVSHTGRENTVLRAGLAPSNVSTIPNAIDATHFYPVPDRAPKDHGTPAYLPVCIVVLSRLMYRKGIDLLLTTIPRLCAMHVGLTFVIGGDGPKYVDLEQMREKHRLQDRVQLVGAVRQRDVCAHLNKGHIFLNTSLTEAFGTSIIEATCAGLLVVTTRVGGIPELLPPSMIRLAEPTDEGIVRETSAAIAQIQNNLHDPMAQHRTVASIYSWSSTVERLQTAYQRAMATPPRSTSERFRRYHAAGGPIGGKIICIVVAVQILLLMALDRLWPRSSIYRARSMQKTGPTHRASS